MEMSLNVRMKLMDHVEENQEERCVESKEMVRFYPELDEDRDLPARPRQITPKQIPRQRSCKIPVFRPLHVLFNKVIFPSPAIISPPMIP